MTKSWGVPGQPASRLTALAKTRWKFNTSSGVAAAAGTADAAGAALAAAEVDLTVLGGSAVVWTASGVSVLVEVVVLVDPVGVAGPEEVPSLDEVVEAAEGVEVAASVEDVEELVCVVVLVVSLPASARPEPDDRTEDEEPLLEADADVLPAERVRAGPAVPFALLELADGLELLPELLAE